MVTFQVSSRTTQEPPTPHPPPSCLHPHPPTTSLHPAFSQMTTAEVEEALSPWLHWALASAPPSQHNSGSAMPHLSAVPPAQPVSGCAQCLPRYLSACPDTPVPAQIPWCPQQRTVLCVFGAQLGTAILCAREGNGQHSSDS